MNSEAIDCNGIVTLGPRTAESRKNMVTYADEVFKSGTDYESPFCEAVAGRVTGQSVKDATIIFTGNKGSGKSYSSLMVAFKIAQFISKIRTGNTHNWRTFFNMSNVATLDDARQVLGIFKDKPINSVFLIDDSAVAMSSRQHMSAANQALNMIMLTIRPLRGVVIFNSVRESLIDKQARDLIDFSINVEESHHDLGFNVLKIYCKEISKSGKEYRKHPIYFGKRVDTFICPKPPAELLKDYDKTRLESVVRLRDQLCEKLDKINGVQTQQKENPYKEVYEELGERYKETVERIHQRGGGTYSEVARATGLSRDRARKLCAQLGIEFPHVSITGRPKKVKDNE
jgi:hypothetical protein